MKRIAVTVIAFVSLVLLSCDPIITEDDYNEYVTYEQVIEASLSEKEPCTNPEDWEFVKVDGPCGGTTFVYSKKIDKENFLKLANQYSLDMKKRLHLTQRKTSCTSLQGTPTGIVCEDNKPIVIYAPENVEE